MPDLVTHAALGWLAKAATGGRHTPSFVAGCVAPDLLGRAPALVAGWVQARWPPLPDLLVYGWEPLHTPAGLAVVAWLLSRTFSPEVRWAVFGNLLAGMALHVALDLLQDHSGVGQVLFFPFSFRSFELGWVGSEDSVFVAPVLAVAVAIVAWRRRRRPTPP